MADTNPHVVDPTQQGDSTKQISLELLKRYHHNLLSVLRLTNDTGTYKYGGERTDFPEDIETVGAMLDKLYDLAKDGSVEFSSGKSDAEGVKEVSFNTDDDDATNLYWINAKVGDETINIKLDADNFVKDSVLKSVQLVTVIEDEEGNKTYKVDGGEASATAPEGFPNDKGAGTYFFYTWEINNGEKGTEYDYTTISLKDVYGDLKGDDYITYDKDNSQIKAQVAEVKATQEATGDTLYFKEEGEGTFIVYSDAEYTTPVSDEFIVPESYDNIPTTFDEQGFTDVVVTGQDPYVGTCKAKGAKTWSVDSEDDTNLATAENLADVAQDLQDQIDAASSQTTLLDGIVTYNTDNTDTTLTSSVTEAGSLYTLDINLASDNDIDGMFAACPTV